MKKILSVLVLFFSLFLVGCANNNTNTDTLVVGMECGYQPFNWTLPKDNGFALKIDGTNQFADGYDVQVSKFLGEKLGKEVVIKKTVWDSLIPDLNNGNLDIVLAGMTATPERRQEIDFSDPYLVSNLAFLISTENLNKDFPGNSKENPATYDELLKAFSGKGLICQMNVVGDGYIDTYFSDVDSTIKHNAALETYPLAANDVKSGNSYAMPAELPVVEAMTNLGGMSVLYVDQTFLSDEDQTGLTVSIGVKKGNSTLLDEINNALSTLTLEQRAKMMGQAAKRSSGDTSSYDEDLVVGMECGYQPFNWTLAQNNGFALKIDGTNQFADGYDIQVAKYLGEKLERNVIIKKTVWDSLIPDLNNGNLDIVLAGMTATPERRQEIDFSDPYLVSDLAFLISTENLNKDFPGNSKENPATYDELLKAFSGKGLICQMNVVGDGYIDTYFSDVDSTIKHNAALETYPLAANDVKSGNAYAMPAELPVVEAMTNLGGMSVLYVDQTFLSEEDQVGLTVSIGVKKGNTKLLDEINNALSSLTLEQRAKMMGDAAKRSAGDTTTSEVTQNKYVTIFSKYGNWILSGVITTLILALFGTIVGLIIGIFIAYGKNIVVKDTDKTIIKWLKRLCLGVCQIYSTVLRGTPMMVQALIFKYGCQALGLDFGIIQFPSAVSDVLNGWLIAGLVVITLNTSAYMAEIVKSGLNGVDLGQVEGARSLGMGSARTSFSIVLPQALRNCLPTIGNELIVNIKDSSVLNVIAVSELFYRIKDIASTSYAFFECYIIVALIYLVLTLLATLVLKLIEKKMDGVKISLNPFRRREEF